MAYTPGTPAPGFKILAVANHSVIPNPNGGGFRAGRNEDEGQHTLQAKAQTRTS